MLTIPQQFEELLKHPENILIMLKKNPLIADTAAALALKKVLENRKKTVEIASENFHAASKMKFLPGLSEIKDNLSHQIGHGGRFGFEKSLGKSEKNSGNRIRKFSRRLQDEISPGPIRDQRQFIPSDRTRRPLWL